ncbi:MAG: RNA polymerase sigma factor [Pseudomonadota bacterium]
MQTSEELLEDKHRQIVEAIPRMRRFAYALTGAAHDADDLVQETIEKALRRLSTFKEGATMHSWLFKIMQNTFIDARRSHGRRPGLTDINDVAEQVSDETSVSGEDAVFAGEVRQAIAALPEPQRLVVAHVLVAGHSYKKTAQSLDIPVGTVMSRLNRARLSLQQTLLGEAPEHV